jgi:hypothetical protein
MFSLGYDAVLLMGLHLVALAKEHNGWVMCMIFCMERMIGPATGWIPLIWGFVKETEFATRDGKFNTSSTGLGILL